MPFYDCDRCGCGTFPWHPRPSTEQLRAWRADGRRRAAGRGVCVNCYKRYRAAGRLDELGHTRHLWRETITDAWFWANHAWELEAEAVALGYATELREYAERHPRPRLKDFMAELSPCRRFEAAVAAPGLSAPSVLEVAA